MSFRVTLNDDDVEILRQAIVDSESYDDDVVYDRQLAEEKGREVDEFTAERIAYIDRRQRTWKKIIVAQRRQHERGRRP